MPEQDAAEITRRWARFYFRRFPYIKGSLDYLGTNDQERIQRIETFAQVIRKLNELLGHTDAIIPEYAEVKELKGVLEGQSIPTLEEVLSQSESSEQIQKVIHRTIKFGRGDFPTWANKEFPLPTISASSILIEGFGYYLGTRIHGENEEMVKQTQVAFRKSFEDVLLMEHPRSPLMEDVIDWMVEERETFNPATRWRIEAINRYS